MAKRAPKTAAIDISAAVSGSATLSATAIIGFEEKLVRIETRALRRGAAEVET